MLRVAKLLMLFILFFLVFGEVIGAGEYGMPPWLSGRSSGKDLNIYLLTFGHGTEVPSYFGHSAILVEDSRLNFSRVYNFGMFDFGPGLITRFLMGRLYFWVGDFSLEGTINYYIASNRDIRVQMLDLSETDKELIAEKLALNVLPENRYYLYDHYFDNCSTRIRDLIDNILNGQLYKFSNRPGRMTLRDHTKRHSQRNFLLNFGMMFLMGPLIDQEISIWDEMFLPMEMEQALFEFSYIDDNGELRPLVKYESIFYEAHDRDPVLHAPFPEWHKTLIIGLISILLSFALAWLYCDRPTRLSSIAFGVYNFAIGSLLGSLGILLSFMWVFTDNVVTYGNQNLLLANPISVFAVPLSIAVLTRSFKYMKLLLYVWIISASMSGVALLLKLFPFSVSTQDNHMFLALFVPLNIGLALSWLWVKKKLGP